MDQDPVSSEPESFADRAFDDLRGEVGLLRRAIEQLVSERQKNETPDYTPTLAASAARLDEIAKFMAAVVRSPAMRLTPEAVANEIAAAGQTARAGDRETIDRAGAALRASIASIDGVVERAWTADRQSRWLVGTGVVGVIAGMLIWSVVPGEIARSLPAAWLVPERMAARTLRLDMTDASSRLLAASRQSAAKNRVTTQGHAPTNADRHQP